MTLSLALILALIALVCGILMLVAGRWSKWPLAAVAIYFFVAGLLRSPA